MHKFYTYITQLRLNLVDFIIVVLMAVLIEAGHYFAGALVFIFGVIGSVLFRRKIQQINNDRLWKGYAAQGQTIPAIKEHRRLYGSSLKDAVDAVRLYQTEVEASADRNHV